MRGGALRGTRQGRCVTKAQRIAREMWVREKNRSANEKKKKKDVPADCGVAPRVHERKGAARADSRRGGGTLKGAARMRKEGTPTRVCKREGPLCTCERRERSARKEKKKKKKKSNQKNKLKRERRRARGVERRIANETRGDVASRHAPGPGEEGGIVPE